MYRHLWETVISLLCVCMMKLFSPVSFISINIQDIYLALLKKIAGLSRLRDAQPDVASVSLSHSMEPISEKRMLTLCHYLGFLQENVVLNLKFTCQTFRRDRNALFFFRN